MSGYRSFSREVARRVPVVSRGFEVETEMTLQAHYRGLVIQEVPVPYGKRPEGSFSKLSTWRDGVRVVVKIVDIWKASALPRRFWPRPWRSWPWSRSLAA